MITFVQEFSTGSLTPAIAWSDTNFIHTSLLRPQPHPHLTPTITTTSSRTTRRRRIIGGPPGLNWASLRPGPTISSITSRSRRRRRRPCTTGCNISRRSRRLSRRPPFPPSGSSAAYAPFWWVNFLPVVFFSRALWKRHSQYLVLLIYLMTAV